MKRSVYVRYSLSLMLLIAIAMPSAALAIGDGKKYFKAGMKHESAETWDKAAEQFAMAVAENPKNPEYKLHLQRALFNASQQYMKKGTLAANEKDYEGGYNAFRKAYSYDPTNELAKSEMERMVRLQKEANGTTEEKKDANGNLKLVQTSYNQKQPDLPLPQRLEKLRDVPFPGGVNLQFIVKELAKDLDLNVLFDRESNLDNRSVKIELKQVSAAKALDYIFLQEGLFFQKVGPRTIIVATQNQRIKFQQLVLRTFYLANANPKDIKAVIQTAIPAQSGRSQTIVLEDAATNSITVRDTSENIRLIGKLISSLDKDRAEVVMDVAIYEVNKNDLLQFGNQIGNQAQLTTLGGTTPGVVGLGGNDRYANLASTTTSILTTALGAGIVLPSANLVAFQNKGNTRLLASTQIHAFNNEDSSARIGQRVPVRTASFAPVAGTNTNSIAGDVINYEQVGLTLKFKPLVFPNQDVQVAMEIESKDIGAGPDPLTPTFTERTIKGTARVQNNKTLLLASVAQNSESNGRSGIPILGLVPVLGRLFTAPRRNNSQVDIVIAVTPRVIRAPAILPEDEVERDTGSIATPTTGSLEAMVIEEDRQELLAAARRLPTATEVQLPDQKAEAPAYVRETSSNNSAAGQPKAPDVNADAAIAASQQLRPIDASAKTLQINQTADTSAQNIVQPVAAALPFEASPQAESTSSAPAANIAFASELPVLKIGEKAKIAIIVNAAAPFRSAVLGVKFDEKRLAVRSVQFGDAFGAKLANTAISPFLNQSGKMFVSLSVPEGVAEKASGVLAVVEIEALADGKAEMTFEKDVLSFLTGDGRNFSVSF